MRTSPKRSPDLRCGRRRDYENNPERWTHPFTPEEVDELSRTADAFIASGTPLTGISKVSPPT